MQLITSINHIIIAKLPKEIINILLLNIVMLIKKLLYKISKAKIY